MTTAVVTGASGFIGRNLAVRLQERDRVRILGVTREDGEASIREKLGEADVVYHLAGSNRPERPEEFYEVNRGFTEDVIDCLDDLGRTPPIIFASSTQVERDNDYGRSKLEAERALERYGEERGGSALVYRLTNVFGKWCRPNYNSVVATFCHRIARDEEIEIHDPSTALHLIHVDDVVDEFLSHLDEPVRPGFRRLDAGPTYEITLGDLAGLLRRFREIRRTLRLPDLTDRLTRLLHSTYLSHLPRDGFAYELEERRDERGKLAELLKSEHFGQIFVSTTRPGVTRGEHYHHTKVEKFCVLAGEAVIRFRQLGEDDVMEYPVSGDSLAVVDIPPGYTHNIENTGDRDMVVLFWASEVFDPDRPDTRYLEVAG